MYILSFKGFGVNKFSLLLFFYFIFYNKATLIQQGLIKSGSKDIYISNKLSIQLRMMYQSYILISSPTVFNIKNNKKCFLSTKSAY